jgi:hypothetical protein
MSEEETVTEAENSDVEEPTPEETAELENEEPEADADSEPAEEPEKPDPRDKKLAELSYKEREARRKLARLERLLEQSVQADTQAKTEAKEPKLEDFETIDEYFDARLEWKTAQQGQPEATAEADDFDPEIEVAKNDLYAIGIEKYDDFAEVVGDEDNAITYVMANAIFEIDEPGLQADVAYYLGNNQKEAKRISRLSPVRQAGEIAKLEIKLSDKAPAKKTASKAPKPIKPVGGTKTASDEIGEKEDFETFLKKRNKQLGRG